MAIETFCTNPACARRYTVAESVAGRSVRCKACGETFIAGKSATMDAPAAPRNLLPDGATTVGRFVIRSELGTGAFGTVYRAHDPQLDREVALKVPHPGMMSDAKRVERFLREAKAAAGLRHPHIVPVFEAGRDGDRYYIASAFIDGQPLSDTIDEKGTDFRRAARIVRELAEALAYAHEQGIVHRDVKPQNVIVDEQDRVHLMDFGLAARQEDAKLTSDGAVMGTPAYMAPEQAAGQKGEAQPASDQYAVGVVLYEMLTGRTPFVGPPALVIHNVLRTEPDSPKKLRPYLSKDVETICLKAMAKRPESRYPDCQALADDLRRWLEGEPVTARRMGLGERAARWVKKEPKLVGALVLIAVALMFSMGLVIGAAQRADTARLQAEKATADARAAEARAEAALLKAQTAQEREERATAGTLGALGSAREDRKKAEALQTQAEEERKKAEALQAQIEEEQKKAKLRPMPKIPAEQDAVKIAYQAFENGTIEDAKTILQIVPAERRGWEWWHVQKLCDLPAGKSPVHSMKFTPPAVKDDLPLSRSFGASTMRPLAYSPDGMRVVTNYRGRVQVLDVNSGAELCVLAVSAMKLAAFSPDGTQIVSLVASTNRVQAWNAVNGVELRTFGIGAKIGAKNDNSANIVMSVAFSPDGTQIVTASMDKTVRVWDVKSGAELLVLKHTGFVCSAAFSPNGMRIVTVCTDATARVWDAKTGIERFAFNMNDMNKAGVGPALFSQASFSPDGTQVVTTSMDKTARVWDATNGAELLVLKHTGSVYSAAFSPNGTRIVTSSDDTTQVWDAKSGAHLLLIRYGSVVRPVAWSADGSKLLVGLADGVEIRDGTPDRAPKP